MRDPNEMDPGIAPWIEFLRGHGFRTSWSCQGGSGHARLGPQVVIDSDTSFTLSDTCARLRNLVGPGHVILLMPEGPRSEAFISFQPSYETVISKPPGHNEDEP